MALGSNSPRARKFVPPKLMITSMMDMFTIILIFLLFQFSEKPETIDMMENIELPKSTAKMDHTETIKLVLTRDSLHINDDMIAQVKEGRVIGLDAQNPKTSALYKRLATKFKQSAETSNEKKPTNHILLLCDRRHHYNSFVNEVSIVRGEAIWKVRWLSFNCKFPTRDIVSSYNSGRRHD